MQSRLKLIKSIISLYPIQKIGLEDVCFNHAKFKWGQNFSTVEIGKTKIREWIKEKGIELTEYKGWETKAIRERLGYSKIKDKAADCFESHCCDSLALALETSGQDNIVPTGVIVVDDTYRPCRRQLHDQQFNKKGIREKYSQGTVNTLRKGGRAGIKGEMYRLTGINRGNYRVTDRDGKRKTSVKLDYYSSQYLCWHSSVA